MSDWINRDEAVLEVGRLRKKQEANRSAAAKLHKQLSELDNEYRDLAHQEGAIHRAIAAAGLEAVPNGE